MADEDLRAHQRRFEDTGSPKDEAPWLAARTRAGVLTTERVVLAARLGHEAARLVVPAAASTLGLLELVGHHEAEVRLRTWLAIGWSVLAVHRDARFELTWAGLEAALIFEQPLPNRSSTLEATGASDALTGARRLAANALFELRPELRPPSVAERLRERGIVVAPEELARMSERLDPRAGPPGEHEAQTSLREVERALGERASSLLAHVRAELVPWALGGDDPVRARCDARQQSRDVTTTAAGRGA